ncbi:MAG: glycosyltransferase family 2 protein [Acidobacteriota bacterium]
MSATQTSPPQAPAPPHERTPQDLESMPSMKDARRRGDRPPVSAIVTTFNEERNIADCLRSILWCDEILVVDSFSTDRTPEIVQAFEGVRFIQRTYYGSAAQKNWAMDQVEHDWILIFDADERCIDALQDEIESLLARGPRHEAYTIRRRVYFMDHLIRFSGWQHDQVVRLIRKGSGRYPNRRVHADMKTKGPAPLLRNPMLHYMADSFDEYYPRIMKYSLWGAAQAWKEGKRAGVAEVFGRSVWRFLRTYLIQGGILDGMYGLVFCMLQAYGTYLKWSILWGWRVNESRGIQPALPLFDDDESTWRGLGEGAESPDSAEGDGGDAAS